MPLDPKVAEFLGQLEAGRPVPLAELDLAEARANIRLLGALGGPPERPAATSELSCQGPGGPIPLRRYVPQEADAEVPLVVYFHGGGFVLGDLDSHDTICHRLSADAKAVVVSVDYRLAPEHRFPAAVEDCEAATLFCATRASELGATGPLVVAGDSAGGNLAAVVSRRTRDRGGPVPALQVLIYPVTDMTWSSTSRSENAEGYMLTADAMRYFEEAYAPSADPKDPDLSPCFAEDLSGLPTALVLTAEFDPLRDEGEAYAAALRSAGVPVTLTRYDGMIHGFYGLDALFDQAVTARQQVATAIREAVGAGA